MLWKRTTREQQRMRTEQPKYQFNRKIDKSKKISQEIYQKDKGIEKVRIKKLVN